MRFRAPLKGRSCPRKHRCLANSISAQVILLLQCSNLHRSLKLVQPLHLKFHPRHRLACHSYCKAPCGSIRCCIPAGIEVPVGRGANKATCQLHVPSLVHTWDNQGLLEWSTGSLLRMTTASTWTVLSRNTRVRCYLPCYGLVVNGDQYPSGLRSSPRFSCCWTHPNWTMHASISSVKEPSAYGSNSIGR